MNDFKANKCPKCKKYILTEYCFECKIDINKWILENTPDIIKDLFGFFNKDKQ